MSTSSVPLFADTHLGDIVSFRHGRDLLVRSLVAFPTPAVGLVGFAVLGECEVVVAFPTSAAEPFQLYIPAARPPAMPARETRVVDGVTRYWAPHLPAVAGAMGELSYAVLTSREHTDPFVRLARSAEEITFVKVATLWPFEVGVSVMRRGDGSEVAVERHSGSVQVSSPAATMDAALFSDLVS
jgi:hypothetical protein